MAEETVVLEAAAQQDVFKWSKEQTALFIQSRCQKEHLFTGAQNCASEGWRTVLEEMGLQGKVTPLQAKRKWNSLKRNMETKRQADKARSKTRVNLGLAFKSWRVLKERMGLKSDAELAFILMESYLQTMSKNLPEKPALQRSSSTETCESDDRETCAGSADKSENGKESEEKDSACRRLKVDDLRMTTSQSENKENPDRDIQEDEDEEFITSLGVGDGRYLVDLGSSSEFVVDEECILELFKSCTECNKKCSVTKEVKGLKITVFQECCFCPSRCKWTNLPDEDEEDFQTNRKDPEHVQTNSANSPSGNTS